MVSVEHGTPTLQGPEGRYHTEVSLVRVVKVRDRAVDLVFGDSLTRTNRWSILSCVWTWAPILIYIGG